MGRRGEEPGHLRIREDLIGEEHGRRFLPGLPDRALQRIEVTHEQEGASRRLPSHLEDQDRVIVASGRAEPDPEQAQQVLPGRDLGHVDDSRPVLADGAPIAVLQRERLHLGMEPGRVDPEGAEPDALRREPALHPRLSRRCRGQDHQIVQQVVPHPAPGDPVEPAPRRPDLMRHAEVQHRRRLDRRAERVEPGVAGVRRQLAGAPLGNLDELLPDPTPSQVANELPDMVVVTAGASVGSAHRQGVPHGASADRSKLAGRRKYQFSDADPGVAIRAQRGQLDGHLLEVQPATSPDTVGITREPARHEPIPQDLEPR